MTPRTEVPTAAVPSLQQLAQTTALAMAVAVVLLVTTVLPAEYAIDPLGTGRWLGLTEIASPPVTPVEELKTPGGRLTPAAKGPIAQYAGEFKLDVFEVTLQPYEYVEYKYHLEEGATMLYAWTASEPLIQDFHGERAGTGANSLPVEESFDKENRRHATGSLTAPFAGIHGWYWENPGGSPVTIRLTTSGFYASAVEIRSDRSRHPRPLRGADTLSAAADASLPSTGR